MIKFHQEQKTKNGEPLTPLLMEGEYIVCATRNGTSVLRKETDFPEDNKVSKKTITAVPKLIEKKEVKKEQSKQKVIIQQAPPVFKQEEKKDVEAKKEVIKQTPKQTTKQGKILKENEKDIQVIKTNKKIEQVKEVVVEDKVNDEEYI